jgi:hypothetical protein
VEFPGVSLELPVLAADELGRAIDHILAAREQGLARRPVASLLSVIDRVVQIWLDPGSPERKEAETTLPAITGLSAQMIRRTLPAMLQPYQRGLLERFLREELGSPDCLDGFLSYWGGRRKAFGPRLVTQVLAGNIPGVGIESLVLALLTKSAVLVKTASPEPLFLALFARSLARIDPGLGECLLVVNWKGGEARLEEAAFSRAEMVIAYGTDKSLSEIRRRVCGRFLGYGHRVSFAFIGREAVDKIQVVASQAACDTALFDQQGCLSPQLFYVERGGRVTPEEFTQALARALAELQRTLPRGQISLAESIAIQQARDEAEWRAIAGKRVVLYASPGGTEWTVIYDEDPTFLSSPLNRTVWVKPVDNVQQVAELLRPWRAYLEAAGVAVAPERLLAVAEVLGEAGVNRVCPVGKMQEPSLSWHHSGRLCLRDLIRWVGVEEPI